MCLMLYLATAGDQPLRNSPDLSVEEVEPQRQAVRRWFSLPTVRFVGAHTGCSCGFPSIIADEPVDYYAGMFEATPEREADLRSVEALIALIREYLQATGEVQMYPVWDGAEGSPPRRTVALTASALDAERFFFHEQFFYRVTA